MAEPGGMDFNTMQQLNSGGQNNDKSAYPGAFPLLKGLGEASLASATGMGSIAGQGAEAGANVNPLAGAGQKGLLDMLGAGTDQRKGPIAKMMAAMFPAGALKQFAEGSSNNSGGGGGGDGDSGSNHPFSAVGSAAQGFAAGGAEFAGSMGAGQTVSPSASPGKGASQDMGI